MALEIIDGSIYRATKPLPLYKNLKNAINVDFNDLVDIIIPKDNVVMYNGIELYYWGSERCHIFTVLYNNQIWYVFHERDFEQIICG